MSPTKLLHNFGSPYAGARRRPVLCSAILYICFVPVKPRAKKSPPPRKVGRQSAGEPRELTFCLERCGAARAVCKGALVRPLWVWSIFCHCQPNSAGSREDSRPTFLGGEGDELGGPGNVHRAADGLKNRDWALGTSRHRNSPHGSHTTERRNP
jgi:hypothetical protein